MSRYVSGPAFIETPLFPEERYGLKPDVQVDGEKRVDTGLLTTTGDRIYRLPPPIGFGRDADW